MSEPARRIVVRGIVQGVGFRPFVYASAVRYGIRGTVKNLGSEVEILASGARIDDFIEAIRRGPPLARIDSLEVCPCGDSPPEGFSILESAAGALTGLIPPDIAICTECLADIDQEGGRYHDYWSTSCVNCGPRYTVIGTLPYDRERTSMTAFPVCAECGAEYRDPHCRRHHAQTIACPVCGPAVTLLDPDGGTVPAADPVREAAGLLDQGFLIAIRGMGGFHIACIEESAQELKRRLGREEQPFAVMVTPDEIERIAVVGPEDRQILGSHARPIVVLIKRDPDAHRAVSNLHTIGCMLPYTGLHHLLFRHLRHPFLIMTSANVPGYPMITGIDHAMAKLHETADFYLTHNREIRNRCDDSVIRDGYIIRLSRGLAPKRVAIDLGPGAILGVGPELNANVSLYRGGFCTTSPHVGNVRNPATFGYFEETVTRFEALLGTGYGMIAHDAHPQFLSTRYAIRRAEETSAELVPVQHHRAHIAATTTARCVGIAIDGVGYGDDGTVWGGEIFAGTAPDLERVGHLEVVSMPGGDLATRFPERMLYGILPDPGVLELLSSRGWTGIETGILSRQLEQGVNVAKTSSTGRVLDAAAALLGICRERTYDGEPAMKLEAFAAGGRADAWDLEFSREGNRSAFSTSALMREAYARKLRIPEQDTPALRGLAASFQYNLARGVAVLAIQAADDRGIRDVALSGGVAYNHAIREAIRQEVEGAGMALLINRDYPLGDGCISFGQCVMAGLRDR
jgi:hydrogenase maturation protein HypF